MHYKNKVDMVDISYNKLVTNEDEVAIMTKKSLKTEIFRWMAENNGRTPRKDDMKGKNGLPSVYQYQKVFKLSKWNDILKEIGVQPKNVSWRSKDEEFISQNWNQLSDKELAIALNRTTFSVAYKRNELGCYRQNQKQIWLENEINFLKEMFYEEDKNTICNFLYPRKWETIRAYATKQLKLKRRNHLHLYILNDGQRKCKNCTLILPENEENFYRDGNSYRVLCKQCYSNMQETHARVKGIITRKLRKELLDNGSAFCGRCKEWKNTDCFRMNYDDKNHIHRYCEPCEKEYLNNYYMRNQYGVNYQIYQDACYEKNKNLYDDNNELCDSIPEKIITNWFISNNITYRKYPFYKEVIKEDRSRRKFDWLITWNRKEYYVEYFGLWDFNSRESRIKDYIGKTKKKIGDLYKYGVIRNCIFIFPYDLKHKTIDEILHEKTQI